MAGRTPFDPPNVQPRRRPSAPKGGHNTLAAGVYAQAKALADGTKDARTAAIPFNRPGDSTCPWEGRTLSEAEAVRKAALALEAANQRLAERREEEGTSHRDDDLLDVWARSFLAWVADEDRTAPLTAHNRALVEVLWRRVYEKATAKVPDVLNAGAAPGMELGDSILDDLALGDPEEGDRG